MSVQELAPKSEFRASEAHPFGCIIKTMLYILAMILVVYFGTPLFVKWLAGQLGRKIVSASKKWLIAAVLSILIANTVFALFYNNESNFFLHAVGGGVMSSLAYRYISTSLGLKINWKVDLLLLLGFVSTLGIVNELVEFALDLMGYGILSLDRQDTWRDLVANTAGALLGWAVIKAFQR